MADDYEYAPSDWWAQEEALAGPVASSDWWAQEEALAGPEASSDWWAQEEALAGPVATPEELKASGYTTTSQPKSSSTAAPTASGVASALKSIGSSLLGKTQSPAGIGELLLLATLMKGYFDPKFGKPQPVGYKGGVDMNRQVAGRTMIPQQARAYGEGAKGQSYFTPTTYAAEGGIMELARGGQPRYLDGATDGMADKINTSIDGKQPAKLSHGEFVIPADVVSHLGNGNSSAGAKVLYAMMAKVRKARTGNKKQGKQINPAKFMPGGIAGYAEGGAVAFATGDIVPPATGTGTATESNLASWAGPYVTDYLSKGKALADQPYQAYTGQLTAGTSPLQQQAMSGLASTGAYQPTQFGNQFTAPTAYQPTVFGNQFNAPTPYQAGQFDTGLGQLKSVQEYMNPYLSNVMDVQSAEARRQADIERVRQAGRLAQAGAFGGSRQAILEAEGNRNLQTQLGGIQATGLQSAYDKALAQRLAESKAGIEAQQLGEQSRQFGAGQSMTGAQLGAQYGLAGLQAGEAAKQFGAGQAMTGAQLGAQYGLAGQQATEASKQFGAKQGLDIFGAQLAAGKTQSDIEQAALDAQRAQFEAQRADPYKKIQFQQSLIEGLPVGTTSTSANTSGMTDLAGLLADLFGTAKTTTTNTAG